MRIASLVVVLFAVACAAPDVERVCEGAEADRRSAWTAVVDANTVTGEPLLVRRERLDADEVSIFVDELRTRADAPSKEAIDAMLAANAREASFNDAEIHSAATVQFVDEADIPRAPRDSQAWSDFAATFGAADLLELSAPGFACEDAAVYVIFECGDFCSRGVVVVLKRDGNAWIVDHDVRLWIS
jgi:hypothetical protein